MKRTVLVCSILFLLIFSLAAYSKASSTITVRKICNYKTSDITSIEFVDKKIYISHKMPLVVKDPKKISEFLGYMDKCKLEKAGEKDAKIGWIYQAVLYSNDKEVVAVTFGDPIVLRTYDDKTKEYNYAYYFPTKNEVTPKKIDDFLAAVNPDWVQKAADTNIDMH